MADAKIQATDRRRSFGRSRGGRPRLQLGGAGPHPRCRPENTSDRELIGGFIPMAFFAFAVGVHNHVSDVLYILDLLKP